MLHAGVQHCIKEQKLEAGVHMRGNNHVTNHGSSYSNYSEVELKEAFQDRTNLN